MTLIDSLLARLGSRPAPSLRPFTKSDWMAFSGCETPRPEIGETEEGSVILDGNTVQFFASSGDEYLTDSYSETYADWREAQAVAEEIATSQRPSVLAKAILTKIS